MDDQPSAEEQPTGSVSDRSQTEVEQRLATQGFGGQFGVRPDASVRCFTCHREFPARDALVDDARRTEGESDPADMALTVPMRCPVCGTSGALSVQYGPQASVEEVEVLLALGRTGAPRRSVLGTPEPG